MKKEVFGVHEWAVCSANFINGCKHDCKYCYSKEMAIRFKRKTADNWKNEEVNFNKLNQSFPLKKGSVMFPSSHDIHPDHLNEHLIFLYNILKSGNSVLIVTKPHFVCVSKILDTFVKYRNKILFRFTIGSCNDDELNFWEPGAPDFSERVESLKLAYDSGFRTSISCEPMLDDRIELLTYYLQDYVNDSIWLGKANFLLKRLKINKCLDFETVKKANQLIKSQTDEYILDLYHRLNSNPIIKWKESIKKIVGISISRSKGLDI